MAYYTPYITTGWWFQPIWKILVKMGIFPKVRGENKKYLKPPPRLNFTTYKVTVIYPWVFGHCERHLKPHNAVWGSGPTRVGSLEFEAPLFGTNRWPGGRLTSKKSIPNTWNGVLLVITEMQRKVSNVSETSSEKVPWLIFVWRVKLCVYTYIYIYIYAILPILSLEKYISWDGHVLQQAVQQRCRLKLVPNQPGCFVRVGTNGVKSLRAKRSNTLWSLNFFWRHHH